MSRLNALSETLMHAGWYHRWQQSQNMLFSSITFLWHIQMSFSLLDDDSFSCWSLQRVQYHGWLSMGPSSPRHEGWNICLHVVEQHLILGDSEVRSELQAEHNDCFTPSSAAEQCFVLGVPTAFLKGGDLPLSVFCLSLSMKLSIADLEPEMLPLSPSFAIFWKSNWSSPYSWPAISWAFWWDEAGRAYFWLMGWDFRTLGGGSGG